MTPEQLAEDSSAQLQRQITYHNVFYGTEDGREVLVDLMQMCYAFSSDPVAMLTRIELFNKIKLSAGCTIETDKAAIDAEADLIEFAQETEDASDTE